MADDTKDGYPMTPYESAEGGVEHPAECAETVVSGRLEEIVRQHQNALLHYAEQMLPDRPDQAHDIVQETFLRLRRALIKGTAIDNPAAWLFRVAHNLSVDLNRRENKLMEFDEKVLPSSDPTTIRGSSSDDGPASAFADSEESALAWSELHLIPHQEREVVLLKLIQGMTLREISELTGANIGTAVHRKAKARNRRKMGRDIEIPDAFNFMASFFPLVGIENGDVRGHFAQGLEQNPEHDGIFRVQVAILEEGPGQARREQKAFVFIYEIHIHGSVFFFGKVPDQTKISPPEAIEL